MVAHGGGRFGVGHSPFATTACLPGCHSDAMEEAAREHLEKALAHRFANVALLTEALTHPSLARGRAEPRSYERLEFLGDRVLGLVVADILRDLYPEATAGDLARRYNALVRREALADVGRGIGLGAYLYIAPADRTAGVAENDTVLSDAMEALLAALYIDGGIEAA
ncbi:MAG: hypothetical protein EXQ91_03695, partial [Alphaproteobacteria bacterium]|nr:hypothetical protein [Alphaproteobacteria bacterium]